MLSRDPPRRELVIWLMEFRALANAALFMLADRPMGARAALVVALLARPLFVAGGWQAAGAWKNR